MEMYQTSVVQVSSCNNQRDLQFFQFLGFQIAFQEIDELSQFKQSDFGNHQFGQVLKLVPGKVVKNLMRFIAVSVEYPGQAPALTPESILGLMSCSNKDCMAPKWAKPLMKPPLKAKPIGYFLVNQLFVATSMLKI